MATVLAGCSGAGPLSVLDPAGPAAAPVTLVWWAMFWGSVASTLLVTALALYAALRRHTAPRVSQRLLLVGGGVVLPSAAVLALLVWGVPAGHALLPRAGAAAVFTVEVTARQWQWEVRYPARPDLAPRLNRIDVPAGQPVDVRVRADDVIHSFWVPRLGGKMDAIPGRTNVVRLQADAPGLYRGLCAEYCGTGHARMPIEVHAHGPEALRAALAGGAR